jgi:hypothetical protein
MAPFGGRAPQSMTGPHPFQGTADEPTKNSLPCLTLTNTLPPSSRSTMSPPIPSRHRTGRQTNLSRRSNSGASNICKDYALGGLREEHSGFALCRRGCVDITQARAGQGYEEHLLEPVRIPVRPGSGRADADGFDASQGSWYESGPDFQPAGSAAAAAFSSTRGPAGTFTPTSRSMCIWWGIRDDSKRSGHSGSGASATNWTFLRFTWS